MDGVFEDVFDVDRFYRRFGDFKYDGLVGIFLRFGRGRFVIVGVVESGEFDIFLGLVVGGVVGEDSGMVEVVVVFGEV